MARSFLLASRLPEIQRCVGNRNRHVYVLDLRSDIRMIEALNALTLPLVVFRDAETELDAMRPATDVNHLRNELVQMILATGRRTGI